jgi:nucleotide-binding universal stress UspA family protein
MVLIRNGLRPLGAVVCKRDPEAADLRSYEETMMNTNGHSPGSITVAVDHSQHAYDATEWAAELAKALKAPLHLVYVDSANNPGAATRVPLDTWLGMLRVAAWRAGTYPEVMTTVAGPVESAMTEFAAGARLLVLGVDLSTHASETALVTALARRGTSPVAVLRGHAPGLGSPLCGPVVIASGPAVPPFAAEVAAGLDAPVEPVDIGAADARTSLSTLLERAHRARIVVLDPPDHLTAPGGWFDDASRLLVEQATCPVIVLGPVKHPAQVGEPAGLVAASH